MRRATALYALTLSLAYAQDPKALFVAQPSDQIVRPSDPSGLFNMAADCPALGFRIPILTTDAYAAIQGCIWAKMRTNTRADKRMPLDGSVLFQTFVLRKQCQGQYSCDDYTSSHQIDLPWNAHLVGTGGHGQTYTTIHFTEASRDGGILLRGYGGIENLSLRGSFCFTETDANTFVLPAGFGGRAVDDGVQIGGNSTATNVTARCFGRHGFNWDSSIVPGVEPGAGALQADEISGTNLFAANNRGDGFHLVGGDAGVNTLIQLQARSNQLYGVYDEALYSSTFINYLGDDNHSDRTQYHTGARVWAAAGDKIGGRGAAGGCVYGPQGTWIGSYCEGDQPAGTMVGPVGINQASLNIHPQGTFPTDGATISQDNLKVVTNGLADRGDAQSPVRTYLDLNADYYGYYALDMVNGGTAVNHAISSMLGWRRTVYGGASGYWCAMQPGNYDQSLWQADICLSDKLTNTGRDAFPVGGPFGFTFLPNGFGIGSSKYRNGQADIVITSDTAPHKNCEKIGDLIVNNTPTPGGVFAWQCTTIGKPGHWTPLSFPIPK